MKAEALYRLNKWLEASPARSGIAGVMVIVALFGGELARGAVQCLAYPAVQACMGGLGACSGPAKQCAVGQAAYRTSCLDLCRAHEAQPADAGAD